MDVLEVFADVSCPFTHVGLRRFVAARGRRGRTRPLLAVRAWPLELVNGEPMSGPALAPKVEALRTQVAPDLFSGFDPGDVPTSTLHALAAEVAAQRTGDDVAEAFSLALRTALFEDGRDVGDRDVVDGMLEEHGAGPVVAADSDAVLAAHREGIARGVQGSPYFFVGSEGFFCPSLDIAHHDGGYDISFDVEGFDAFTDAVFAEG